jgi:8-oxo-dGTP pyrophosphatase MutT (NUDIX family)
MNTMDRFTQSTKRAFNSVLNKVSRRRPQTRRSPKPSAASPVAAASPAPTVKNAAIVFITPTNRTILVKMALGKDRGKWALPGGQIDPGETPLEAALREFMEETSLTIDQSQITEVQDYHVRGYSTLIFIIKSTQRFGPYNKRAVKNKETDALVYISIAHLSDLVFHQRPWGDVKELRNFETFRRLFVNKLIQA